MTTWGVSMMRDEADVAEGTLRHMAGEVDRLIVADNRSIDGTREILARLAEELPLTVVDDLDPAYYQALKMTALAARAAAEEPDDDPPWIVPFDADELWYSPYGRIREVLADLSSGFTICQAPLYNHFRTGLDVDDPDPFRSMVWRMSEPGALGKVAFRWQPGAKIQQGNHGVVLPHDPFQGYRSDALELRHFPFRSPEQFVTKAANGAEAYRLTDLPYDMGQHWRSYGEILDRHGEAGLRSVYHVHFVHWSPTDAGMVRDPAPYLRWEQQ